MPTLTIRCGTKTAQVDFQPGAALSAVLHAAGFAIAQPCGGRGVCGKCAVEITGDISASTAEEQRLGVRLACRTTLHGDATVLLPVAQPMAIETGADDLSTTTAPGRTGIGAAIDIGTTTLALRLYDLATGHCLAASAMPNPQTAVAADVIGRIDAAMHGKQNMLQQQITGALHTMLTAAAAQAGISATHIGSMVITGNTTMLYLLTGRDPTTLSHAPFEADCLFGTTCQLPIGTALLPPCLHAFVGADITCAVLASNMCSSAQTALLCDVGTNGEIALWHKGTLYVASTAAGPAFEGAGISCGCPSIQGAIDQVWIESTRLQIHTIGDAPAAGLCGSGLIDAVTALLMLEAIDETGAMDDDCPLAPGVTLTQADIRAVQLSKAAIAAGIDCLLAAAGCTANDVDTLYLAGGFGSRLNINNAAYIGLLPAPLAARAQVLGNAALHGAAQLLLNPTLMHTATHIAACARHVNLGGNPLFNSRYIDAMMFENATI